MPLKMHVSTKAEIPGAGRKAMSKAVPAGLKHIRLSSKYLEGKTPTNVWCFEYWKACLLRRV